jgi:hypothetical protein
VRQLLESQSPITLAQSSECAGCQYSGVPRARNSGAEKRPRSPIQAFTPIE